MINELAINEIYNEVINVILNGVNKKYNEEISVAYKNYLLKTYLNFEMMGKAKDDLLPIFINLEISKWKKATQNVKLSEFLIDEVLNNIRNISNNGYKYALSQLNQRSFGQKQINLLPVLDEDTAEKNILTLQNLLPKVREFNQDLASNLVSEGIVDFMYASGKTDNMSLRVGRMR